MQRLHLDPICLQCKRTAPKRLLVRMLLLAATGRAEHVAPFMPPPPSPARDRASRVHTKAVFAYEARPRERLRVLVWLAVQTDSELASRVLQHLGPGW